MSELGIRDSEPSVSNLAS